MSLEFLFLNLELLSWPFHFHPSVAIEWISIKPVFSNWILFLTKSNFLRQSKNCWSEDSQVSLHHWTMCKNFPPVFGTLLKSEEKFTEGSIRVCRWRTFWARLFLLTNLRQAKKWSSSGENPTFGLSHTVKRDLGMSRREKNTRTESSKPCCKASSYVFLSSKNCIFIFWSDINPPKYGYRMSILPL